MSNVIYHVDGKKANKKQVDKALKGRLFEVDSGENNLNITFYCTIKDVEEKDRKIKILEKALEMACEIAVDSVAMDCSPINCNDSCMYHGKCECINKVKEHFKSEATKALKAVQDVN